MTNELAEKEQPSPNSPAATAGRRLVVLKFIAGWLGSLVVLAAIALMANIEWLRPTLEESLAEGFHRKVSLGRLSWNLGLNGLAVETDRFTAVEADTGKPFVAAGHSEIGLAFLPLFEKKIIVKHLMFKTPEVWAVRLPDGKWNYSDLLTEGPEIHLVQIDKGILHLRNLDAADKSWSAYDLDDIRLKFVFPRKDKDNWPLYFACRVPIDGKTTTVRLNLTGSGEFAEWQKHKYSGDLELTDFNPRDFEGLMPFMPDVDGTGDVSLTGEGIFADGLTTRVKASLATPRFAVPGNHEAKLPSMVLDGKLCLNPTQASWADLKLKIDRFDFGTTGSIDDWTSADPNYKVNIGGSVQDLNGFAASILSQVYPDPQVLSGFSGDADTARANMSLRLYGKKDNIKLAAVLKADGVPLHRVLKVAGCKIEDLPLKVDKEAPVSGELSIDGAGGVYELSDFNVAVDKTMLKLSGKIEGAGDTDIDFSVKEMPVHSLASRLTGTEFDGLPLKGSGLTLDGTVSIDGKYHIKNGKSVADAHIVPVNLALVNKTGKKLIRDLQGEIHCDGDSTSVSGLTGVVDYEGGSGSISIKGEANPALVDVKVEGKSIDTAMLKDLAGQSGMHFPSLSVTPERGLLKGFNLSVKGKPRSPELLDLYCEPDDVIVEATAGWGKGPPRVCCVHVSGGSIALNGSVMTLRDLTITSKSSRALVSAKFNGAPEKPEMETLSVRTDGIDVAEWQPFLRPSWLAAAKDVPAFLLPAPRTPLAGRIYGDLKIVNRGKWDVEAVVGLNNLSGTFGKHSAHLERITGLVSISPKSVTLQDVGGVIGRSSFTVDGGIDDYMDAKAITWSGMLRGRFYSEELARITTLLKAPVKLTDRSGESLALRLSGSGDSQSYKLSVSGRAEPTLGLKLETDYCTLMQPENARVTLDGQISVVHGKQTELTNMAVVAGEDHFQLSGKLKDEDISLVVASKGKVAARNVLSMINSDKSLSDVKGAVEFSLNLDGPVTGPCVEGTIDAQKVSVPAVDLTNLTGKLTIDSWSLSGKGPAKPMKAAAAVDTVSLGELDFKSGTLKFQYLPADGGRKSSRVELSEGDAQMAGGKVGLTGFYEPGSGDYRLKVSMNNLGVHEFVQDLMARDGKVSGSANVSMTLFGTVGEAKNFLKDLNGAGEFQVLQGTVVSFGKLQEKLNGANLLQQGIFGFNINNLVQTVMPVNNGSFKEIEGKMRIERGVIYFDGVRYDGDNLRMRAAGKVDLPSNKVVISVAGDIPRVASSIIPGPFGEVSRTFTLQKAVKFATFRQLKDLPALPLLGDIANDDPRSFAFNVEGPVDKPKQVSQCAEKTFHWLPNKPYASAHPVPDI